MRISDWSSDVCSSDLEREVTDRRDMLKLAGAGLLGTGLSGFGAPGLAATAAAAPGAPGPAPTWTKGFDGQRKRSEEHTSELQSLMRISYAVFCLKKTNQTCSHTFKLNSLNHII